MGDSGEDGGSGVCGGGGGWVGGGGPFQYETFSHNRDYFAFLYLALGKSGLGQYSSQALPNKAAAAVAEVQHSVVTYCILGFYRKLT